MAQKLLGDRGGFKHRLKKDRSGHGNRSSGRQRLQSYLGALLRITKCHLSYLAKDRFAAVVRREKQTVPFLQPGGQSGKKESLCIAVDRVTLGQARLEQVPIHASGDLLDGLESLRLLAGAEDALHFGAGIDRRDSRDAESRRRLARCPWRVFQSERKVSACRNAGP